jgi:Sad1 / UNC-like C-terminal
MLPLGRRNDLIFLILHFALWFLIILGTVTASTDGAENSTSSTPNSSSSISTSVKPSSSSSTPSIVSTSTSLCPSRTINYLTHTLPQQCLKTNWTRHVNYTTSISSKHEIINVESLENATQSGAGSGGSSSQETTVLPDEIEQDNAGKPGIVTESSGTTSTVEGGGKVANASSSGSDPAETDAEADSPLDNSKFLSFEEWKKQNLEKALQASDSAGKARRIAENRRQMNLDNQMDTLGEEGEIDLAFFGSGETEDQLPGPSSGQDQKIAPVDDNTIPASHTRKKDAGTTCKERFNYASFDCAASIIITNPKCKSPRAILVENKDSYMLNECSTDNKFLIVELCDNILIDTVVLANFEFFSSMFRTFRVSISDRYPVKADRWKELGTFTARNSRDIQAFAVENPLIWAKYLRVEFLTHYGSEYYCPVSLLRVHGTTMIEDLKAHEEPGKDEDEAEIIATPEPASTAEAEMSVSVSEVATPERSGQPVQAELVKEPVESSSSTSSQTETTETSQATTEPTIGPSREPASIVSIGPLSNITHSNLPQNCQEQLPVSKSASVVSNVSNSSESSQSSESSSLVHSEKSAVKEPELSQNSSSEPTSAPVKGAIATSDVKASSQAPSASGSDAKPVQSSSDSTKVSSTSIQQPPAPSPTTQESFFKSVHKRLQMLEANATLSLQYIEEQSRILRDAFTKVEKRQMGKTEEYLRHLNDSVISELKTFRQQYDQLWQSTVIELETHREQYQREILAVSTRLTILADELVWQKRMAVIQSTLLLICLFLVIFGRAGASHLELPIMQHVLNKSYTRIPTFPFDSAPGSPSSKDNSPQRKSRTLARSRSDGLSSDDVPLPSPAASSRSASPITRVDLIATPNTDFSPAAAKDADVIVGDQHDSPLLLDERIRALRRGEARSRSGPATPRGTRDTADTMSWSIESRASSFASSKGSQDDDGAVDVPSRSRTGSPTVRFRGSMLANGYDDDVLVGAGASREEEREKG